MLHLRRSAGWYSLSWQKAYWQVHWPLRSAQSRKIIYLTSIDALTLRVVMSYDCRRRKVSIGWGCHRTTNVVGRSAWDRSGLRERANQPLRL